MPTVEDLRARLEAQLQSQDTTNTSANSTGTAPPVIPNTRPDKAGTVNPDKNQANLSQRTLCCYINKRGTPCGNWAVDRDGRCATHPKSRDQIRPDKDERESILQLADELVRDPELHSLAYELATLKAMMRVYLTKWEHGDNFDWDIARQLVNDTGKLVHRIETVKRQKAYTVAEIRLMQAKALAVFQRYFTDPETRKRFLRDLQDATLPDEPPPAAPLALVPGAPPSSEKMEGR